jgi:hypothetical protein
MQKRPEEKNIEDIPNIVNEALCEKIRKFSQLVYTLLKEEPYTTQEELKYLKHHGPDPQSFLERILKLFTSKGYIDRNLITPIFIDAFCTNIEDGFNYFCARPEKLEEYLFNLITLLNRVFDHIPDSNTSEGKALLEEMQEKQKRREKLVREAITKGIAQASDDKIADITGVGMTKHQYENLLISYRKLQKRATSKERGLPKIEEDVRAIFDSTFVYPTVAQAFQAKQQIEKTMLDIERLFIAISNVMSTENGPVRRRMVKDLKVFVQDERTLKDAIIAIKAKHDQKVSSQSLVEELRNLTLTINTKPSLSVIERHLQRLNEINKNHQFDEILVECKNLEKQLQKIKQHHTFARRLQEILRTSFFKNNILQTLAKVQKDYSNNPRSAKIASRRNRIKEEIQAVLTELENVVTETDLQEIIRAINNILNSSAPKVNQAYESAISLIEKKIAEHNASHTNEINILPICYINVKKHIETHTATIPNTLESINTELIQQIEILQTTVDKMQRSVSDIGKHSFIDSLDGITISKILASLSSFGSSLFGLFPYFSIGLGTVSLASTFITPSGIARNAASSVAVPLAERAAKNGYNLAITNDVFYEGLFRAFMRSFIDYIKETEV